MSLLAPMQFSVPNKSASWRPELQLRAEAEDAARRRGLSLTKLVDWCVETTLRLSFLDVDNRALVLAISRELGRPWTPLDVVNRLVTEVREQIRAGRMLLGFGSGQRKQLSLFES
jgi:hypothetical protein